MCPWPRFGTLSGRTCSRCGRGHGLIWLIGLGVLALAARATRRRARERRESDAKFRDLFENAPVAYHEIDRDGVIDRVNRAECELLGFQAGEMVGRRVWEFVAKADREASRAAVRRKLSGVQPLAPVRRRYVRRDGGEVLLEIHDSLVRNAAGETAGIRSALLNITERQRAEEALRESEARFDQLAEQSGTIVWEVDAQGLYTYVSHVSEAVWGYHPDELVGRMHFYDLHPEDGREAFKTAAFAVMQRKESFQDLINAVEGKDGRLVWVSTNGIPLLNPDGTLRGYRGSDTDITERKRAEEGLRENENSLRESQIIAGLGSYVLDIPTGLWKSSAVLDEVFGIDEAYERSVEGWIALLHPGDRTMMADYLRNEVLGQGRRFDKEYRIVRHATRPSAGCTDEANSNSMPRGVP